MRRLAVILCGSLLIAGGAALGQTNTPTSTPTATPTANATATPVLYGGRILQYQLLLNANAITTSACIPTLSDKTTFKVDLLAGTATVKVQCKAGGVSIVDVASHTASGITIHDGYCGDACAEISACSGCQVNVYATSEAVR